MQLCEYCSNRTHNLFCTVRKSCACYFPLYVWFRLTNTYLLPSSSPSPPPTILLQFSSSSSSLLLLQDAFTPNHRRNLVGGRGKMPLQYLLCLRIYCGYLVEGRQMETEIFKGLSNNNSTAVRWQRNSWRRAVGLCNNNSTAVWWV